MSWEGLWMCVVKMQCCGHQGGWHLPLETVWQWLWLLLVSFRARCEGCWSVQKVSYGLPEHMSPFLAGPRLPCLLLMLLCGGSGRSRAGCG